MLEREPAAGRERIDSDSGRAKLLAAARSLLTEHSDRDPSTREIYDAAGVTAPTLYHHFGTKKELLEVVVDKAFTSCLARKGGLRRTGDLILDLAAGRDMHVEFGVAHPKALGCCAEGRDGASARPRDTGRGRPSARVPRAAGSQPAVRPLSGPIAFRRRRDTRTFHHLSGHFPDGRKAPRTRFP